MLGCGSALFWSWFDARARVSAGRASLFAKQKASFVSSFTKGMTKELSGHTSPEWVWVELFLQLGWDHPAGKPQDGILLTEYALVRMWQLVGVHPFVQHFGVGSQFIGQLRVGIVSASPWCRIVNAVDLLVGRVVVLFAFRRFVHFLCLDAQARCSAGRASFSCKSKTNTTNGQKKQRGKTILRESPN